MEKLDSCYKLLRQSRTGLTAIELAKKLGKHRATIHRELNSLELMGKVRNEGGRWKVREDQHSMQPVEIPSIVRRVFQQTDEVKQILFKKKDFAEALERMKFIIAQLDDSMKKEMEAEIKNVEEGIKATSKFYGSLIERRFGKKPLSSFDGSLSGANALIDTANRAAAGAQREGTYKLLSKLYSLIYSKYPIQDMIGVEGVEP